MTIVALLYPGKPVLHQQKQQFIRLAYNADKDGKGNANELAVAFPMIPNIMKNRCTPKLLPLIELLLNTLYVHNSITLHRVVINAD